MRLTREVEIRVVLGRAVLAAVAGAGVDRRKGQRLGHGELFKGFGRVERAVVALSPAGKREAAVRRDGGNLALERLAVRDLNGQGSLAVFKDAVAAGVKDDRVADRGQDLGLGLGSGRVRAGDIAVRDGKGRFARTLARKAQGEQDVGLGARRGREREDDLALLAAVDGQGELGRIVPRRAGLRAGVGQLFGVVADDQHAVSDRIGLVGQRLNLDLSAELDAFGRGQADRRLALGSDRRDDAAQHHRNDQNRNKPLFDSFHVLPPFHFLAVMHKNA